MTKGEMMVWAAAYAVEYHARMRERCPRDYILPGNEHKRAEWECGNVHAAIETAYCAVSSMGDERDAYDEGWEGDDSVAMLDEMLGLKKGAKG